MPTVQFKDYYKTLGVDRNADEKAIRTAYRKLVRKLHPDVNRNDPQAEEKIKDVNEAYEVLSDTEKRRMYDRFGADWERYRDAGFNADSPEFSGPTGGAAGGPQDFGEWFAGQAGQGGTFRTRVEYGDGTQGGGRFSDFFDLLFGAGQEQARGAGRAARPQRGQDIEVDTKVTLREAFTGTTRRLTIAAPAPCPTCNGTGIVRGAMCPTCDGTGEIQKRRTIEVNIPKGVQTRSRVRVAGQGGAGTNGGPNGDVYLRIEVTPDPRFERNGDELTSTVDVPLYTAVLGGEVIVPTIDSRVALSIPKETQSGRRFRLRGKGMPKLGKPDERGDLVVTTNIVIPQHLSDQERALFEELRDLRQ